MIIFFISLYFHRYSSIAYDGNISNTLNYFQDELEYTIIPKAPETDFFYMHPETGVLSLAKVLSVEDRVYYRVCGQCL